jgi:hypothetical protein
MFADSNDLRAANEDFLEAAYLNRCDGLTRRSFCR